MISDLTHQGPACHRLRRGELAWPFQEHPWWSRYELEAVLSATTFNKQAGTGLGAHTEHLRKSVT